MSKREDRGFSPAWRGFTKVILPPLIRGVMKRDWRGHEHIPAEGPVIIAPNHLSYADWAAVALFVHEAGRYPAFLVKSGVFKVKFLGAFLHACGQLPVHRGQTDAALVLKEAERSLTGDECIVVYPEGTASRDPEKWPMVAKTGVARLALATGAPVIPVACWGAQDILPYGTKKPHVAPRHEVRMLAGPPVDLSAFAGQPLSREVLRAATDVVMADVTRLLAQLRGETPPEKPFDPVAARRAATGTAAPGTESATSAAGAPPDGGSDGQPTQTETTRPEAADPDGDAPRKAAPA